MFPAASSHHFLLDVYPLGEFGSPYPHEFGEMRYDARNEYSSGETA
jgi:hypothetical protein